jgi:sRNA-binding regulator protein Hfq
VGVEARMEEIARKKGMKTTSEVEQERINKIEEKNSTNELTKTKKPNLKYFLSLIDKNIVVTLQNDTVLEGVLRSFSTYELCLELSSIPELIVFKHAIAFLHEKQTKQPLGGEKAN